MGLVVFVVLLAVAALVVGAVVKGNQRKALERKQAELEPVRKLAFEDVTALGEELQQLGIEGTGRYVAVGTARRGVGDVLDRQPVARVEEARRPPDRQRLARDPRPDARHRVAAVLEDLGDVLDVLGLGDPVARGLGAVSYTHLTLPTN